MTSFRSICLATVIALCPAALPAMASASTTQDEVSVAVPAGDLDLTSPQGVAVLKQRIRDAAKTVCTAAYAPAGVTSDLVRECRIEAARDARADARPGRMQLSANAR